MAREGNVVFRFLGDVRDLRSKLGDAGKEIDNFTTRSQKRIDQGFSRMGDFARMHLGPLGGVAGDTFDKIGTQAAASGSTIGLGIAAGTAVAGAAFVGLAAKGIASYTSLVSQVRNFQRVSGASAEDSSRLVAGVKGIGVEADVAAGGMFRLSRAIETKSAALAADGITIARNKDGSTDLYHTLLNVSDAYKRAGSGAEGNAIAFDAFGKSGAALLPILAAGRERLAEFADEAAKNHAIVTDEQIKQVRDYNASMHALGQAGGALGRELGAKLVPLLSNMAQGLALDVQWLNKLVDSIAGPVSFVLRHLGLAHKSTAKAATDQAAAEGDLADGLDTTAAAADSVVDSLGKYKTALDATLGAHSDLNDAARAVADAEKQVADDLHGTGDAADSTTGKIRTYQDALGDIFDSVVDVDRAHDSATDAVDGLAKALGRAGQGSEDAAAFMDRWAHGGQAAGKSATEIRGAVEDAVQAAEREVDAMAKSGEIADTAGARKAALADRLNDLKKRFPEVSTQIDRYLGALSKVPNLTTDAETANSKLGKSKRDLAADTDALITAARNEAGLQDTINGQYGTLLSRLEALKKKYPELATAIQKAIDDTKAAYASLPADVFLGGGGGGFSGHGASGAFGSGASGSFAAPTGGFLSGPLGAVQRVVNNTINVKVEGSGITAEGVAEMLARKVAFAITSTGR